jgi:hypothetical protein
MTIRLSTNTFLRLFRDRFVLRNTTCPSLLWEFSCSQTMPRLLDPLTWIRPVESETHVNLSQVRQLHRTVRGGPEPRS